MNEEIKKQGKIFNIKRVLERFLAKNGYHIVLFSFMLLMVDVVLILLGEPAGIYILFLAWLIFSIGSYGDLYLGKHMVTQ
jgi:hypothetical protein